MVVLHCDGMPRLQTCGIARTHARLRADHFDLRRNALDRRGKTAEQTAARDGRDHHVKLRALLHHLKADGSLSRHDTLVIKRRHHGRAGFLCNALRHNEALCIVAFHDRRAERADSFLFQRRCRVRDNDSHLCTEHLRGESKCTAVVAGGCCHKTAVDFFLRQRHGAVHCAAQLERADVLHALRLNIHLAAERSVEVLQTQQRRFYNIGCDPLMRFFDHF